MDKNRILIDMGRICETLLESDLIFEDEAYKLKIALSDINGWDVRPHYNKPEQLVLEFRKWA